MAWVGYGARARPWDVEEQRHELRATLFGIEASAEGLACARTRMTSAQLDQLALALVGEVRRLRGLLDGRPSDVGAFDLADVVARVVAAVSAGGQQVHARVRPGLVVEGDSDRTAQVLIALLDNARHHASGSPVELRVATQGAGIRVYVEDRGPGIGPELEHRIFARGVSGVSGRSGLGLCIARRLMTEQGGSITARARPGGGSTFVLRLRRPV